MVAAVLLVTTLAAPPDTIRAGNSELLLPMEAAVDTVDNFVVRDGERQLAVRFVQSIRPVDGGFLVVQENRDPSDGLLTLDSVVVATGTLATRYHGDVTPGGTRHVAFSDGRMTGAAVDTSGTRTVVDEPIPPGHFDYSVMTLVMDRLPLEAGYHGVLATWDITRGAVYVPFRVTGEETVRIGDTESEAWKMEVDVGPTTVTRWIDRSTRKELRWSVDFGGRTMIGERR